ncbi:MAG: serine/threonine protein kinase [Clostridia bacterium]|nr:serine/threonine protein kinase [Clostridia bacterium]
MLKVGDIFDEKYEVVKILGSGGMGTVYLTKNVKLGTLWSIKEVDKINGEKVDLLAEPNILKKLNHPALPRIFDIIEDENRMYIVLDYIEGETLEMLLDKRGCFPEKTVIEWTKQICNVLAYLHSQKPPIIYRDMKPANLIIAPDGEVNLIDFGIAREYKKQSTTDTTYIGTRGFAAPEQYGTAQSDARTDIYSLGVTMYNLLTGKSPNEPPYEIMPVRQINKRFSAGIEYIIAKCTEQNPINRYSTVQQLLDDLNNINALGNSGVNEKNTVNTPKKKNKAARVLFLFLILASLLGVAYLGWSEMEKDNINIYDKSMELVKGVIETKSFGSFTAEANRSAAMFVVGATGLLVLVIITIFTLWIKSKPRKKKGNTNPTKQNTQQNSVTKKTDIDERIKKVTNNLPKPEQKVTANPKAVTGSTSLSRELTEPTVLLSNESVQDTVLLDNQSIKETVLLEQVAGVGPQSISGDIKASTSTLPAVKEEIKPVAVDLAANRTVKPDSSQKIDNFEQEVLAEFEEIKSKVTLQYNEFEKNAILQYQEFEKNVLGEYKSIEAVVIEEFNRLKAKGVPETVLSKYRYETDPARIGLMQSYNHEINLNKIGGALWNYDYEINLNKKGALANYNYEVSLNKTGALWGCYYSLDKNRNTILSGYINGSTPKSEAVRKIGVLKDNTLSTIAKARKDAENKIGQKRQEAIKAISERKRAVGKLIDEMKKIV